MDMLKLRIMGFILSFNPPESPPGCPWRIVVLIVIAEKVAAQKCPKMV
jgi:hypothetical protein